MQNIINDYNSLRKVQLSLKIIVTKFRTSNFNTPQKHLVLICISYFIFEVVLLAATKFLTRKNKRRVDEILMTTISKNVRKT